MDYTVGERCREGEGVDFCVVYLAQASVEKWVLDSSFRQDT